MDIRSFLIGFGIAGSLLFLALPEMVGFGNKEPREISRSLPAPRATRIADIGDEEISARKNYQPPDHWRWKYEADEQVVCEPIETPWGWDRVCHTIFERPIGYPAARRRPDRARGGCPCPQQRQQQPEDDVDEPQRNPGLIAANVKGPYG
jgi:hypothetical protein